MSDDVDNKQFRNIWRDALVQYTKRSGVNLPSPAEFAQNPDEALTMIQGHMEKFKEFRKRKEGVLKVVKPFFDMVQVFVDKAGEGASLAPAPYDSATKLLFSAVGILLQAAKEVSKSYDLIVDLLRTLNDTLERYNVYLQHTITAPLRRIITDALVQLLLILAMARKIIAERRLRRFWKSLTGKNTDVDDAVKELDRIFTREGRMVRATVLDHTTQLVEHMRLQTPASHSSPEPRPELKQCPPPTDLFTGRVNVLAQMRKFFFGTGSKKHVFVLHGLGGAGKTQIACRFVEDHANMFSSVFFVDATSTESISTDLSLIAKTKHSGTDEQSALRWLAAQHTPWLLIFDNADNPAIDLHEHFPSCTHGNILITTRNHDMIRHATPGSESSFCVSDMESRDAVELLLKAANVLSSDNYSKIDAIQLAQELHHFALALIQAGAYIMTMQFSISDYLRLFKERRGQFLEKYLDVVQRSDTYGATVYTTWRLSYDHLNPLSKDLLHICSFLHHENILLEYFELAAMRGQRYRPGVPFTEIESVAFALAQTFLSHFRNEDHSWNETKFRETAHDLISYSLIHFDIKNRAYSIHPLVQEWCQTIDHTPITRVSVQALMSMIISWKKSAQELSFKRKLLPHIDDAISMEDSELTSVPNIADCLQLVYSEAGSWMMTAKLRKVALEYFMEAKGKEDSATLTKMNNLAETYWSQGQLNEAEKLEKEVLEIRKQVLGPEHPDTLSSMNNLASIYYEQGQLDKAEKLQKEVLEISKWVLGPEHPDTLSIMNNLATVYRAQGQLNEAERLNKEVLEIRKRVLGPEHPGTLTGMNNLALTYWTQDQLNEAEKLEKEVLEISKRVLGPEHPSTLLSMHNLAYTYSKQKRWTEAVELMSRTVEGRKRVLGDEHPHTVNSVKALKDFQLALQKETQ